MSSPGIACWVLLLACACACGCGEGPAGSPPAGAEPEAFAGSPLVGRWAVADGRKVLEFLADGTLVELLTIEGERSTRRPDGTIETSTIQGERCSLGAYRLPGEGALAWDLVQVGGIDVRTEAARWRVDDGGATLTLVTSGDGEDDLREVLYRRDLRVSDDLPGLWRRVGGRNPDRVDMGVLFTPGGLSIVIGKNSPWDGTSSTGTSGWLCYFAHYELTGEGALCEVRPSEPERPRTREFQIDGAQLAFVKAGWLGRTYERVAGPPPFRGRDLDERAWATLPVRPRG